MYTAAKVEEVHIRDATDYSDITDRAYSPEEVPAIIDIDGR